MDNKRLAQFITNLGQFNNYGSTVAQTQKALEIGSSHPLNSNNDDRVIFEDTLKAIKKVLPIEFGSESIIAINAQFTGDSDEQPYHPGKLRWALQDPRDKIYVPLWPSLEGGAVNYTPPLAIEKEDLESIAQEWRASSKQIHHAWTIFARLAKLQPFQDGNKRTALIAANHALGALETQNYLMPPTGRHYKIFMDNLMTFYGAGLEGAEDISENEALKNFLAHAIQMTLNQRPQTKFEERFQKAQENKRTLIEGAPNDLTKDPKL
ncbi:Fic family protein [Lactococcus garvieae]|uniref:Fic family protein n=1 Tax=Lactococcus garvieae TaxID=1363 RepID=UPI00385399B4